MVEGLRIGRGGKNQIIQRKGREKGRKTVNIPKKERKEGRRYPGPRSLEDTYASKKIKTQKKSTR